MYINRNYCVGRVGNERGYNGNLEGWERLRKGYGWNGESFRRELLGLVGLDYGNGLGFFWGV